MDCQTATARNYPNLLDENRARLISPYLARWLRPGMRLGLGGGRTVAALLPHLAELYRQGLHFEVVAAASSTCELARSLALPLTDPNTASLGSNSEHADSPLDLLLDGADEVDQHLNLIKGYGGALTREKILAHAAQQRIYLVTPEKLVPSLGSRGRLPIEVVQFGWRWTKRAVEAALGCTAQLRRQPDGSPFTTDNGQYILDCSVTVLEDPLAVERELHAIPGVVATGLFLNLADCVLVLGDSEVRELRRQNPETTR